MIKILFLTLSYPDARRSATIQCTHRIIECVNATGQYEVHVLCLRHEGEPVDEIINDIHIHRVKPSLWSQFRQMNATRNRYKIDRYCELIQKLITTPFYPNTLPYTTMLYSNAAMKLMREEKFNAVLSEYHGLMTLKAGCCLKEKNDHIVHIAFLWDPLKGELQTHYLPSHYTRSKLERLEQYVAKNTTLEISMAVMKGYFEKQNDFAADHRVFLDIPTILYPEEVIKTEHLKLLKKEAINIVFSGKLSLTERNPLPVIELLNKTEVAERINLVFFSMGAKDAIESAKKDFKGSIVYHDYISLNELHTVYRYANYLLNISHINPNMVPSKIFEYMSYGKPIISTFVSDGDAAERCIKRYPEGLCIDLRHKEEDNVAVLNDFLLNEHKQVAFKVVKDMYKENTPEMFMEVIEKTVCTHQ